MASPLPDPNLQALREADPASFLDGPAEPVPVERAPDLDRVGLELAIGFMVARTLISRYLLEQDPRHGEVTVVAGQAWRNHAPTWLRIAVPAIRRAYELGDVGGVSEEELQAMATDYAVNLGDYLNETSGEALADGFARQLDAKWSERLAWERAAAAYGLDKQQMRSYIGAALRRSEQAKQVDPAAEAGRLLADRLLLVRAERMGVTESWRALQAGKAVAWLLQARAGTLPPGALKEWDNTHERACAICRALHGQRVAVTEPFVHPVTKAQLWAPGAHPECQCEMRLVLPADPVGKALGRDPYDRDRKGRFAATEHRSSRPVRHAEPTVADPAVERVLEELRRVKDPFTTPQPFRSAPFQSGQLFQGAQLFGTPPDQLFADRRPGAPLFDRTKRPGRRPPAPERSGRIGPRVVHHVFINPRQPGEPRERGHQPYYLPAEELHHAYEEANGEQMFTPGDVLDFGDAAAALRLGGSYFPPPVGEVESLAAISWPAAEGSPVRMVDRSQPWVEDSVAQQLWREILPHAQQASRQAIGDVDEVVERLDKADLGHIFLLAGYDPREPANSMRERIARAVHGRDGGDPSLAGAYVDHVVWEQPEVLGELGAELGRALDEAQASEVVAWSAEFNQFFAFENGFHQDTQLITDHAADLDRSYLATHVTYHSGLLEEGNGMRPFELAWREISMVPCDDEGRRIPVEP